MKDPVEWAKSVALLLKQHVTRALHPIEARLAAVESRPSPERGEKGEAGLNGLDGKSVTLQDVRIYLDAEIATWALSFERRGQEVLQRALERIQPPKDGIDGKDGAPGFSLDDLQIDDNGEGAVTLRFVRGDLVRERTIRLPVLIDRGVFRDGVAYLKGDGVTFGGSFWIAQQDLPQGKPGTIADWRLAVKKGRDGADR